MFTYFLKSSSTIALSKSELVNSSLTLGFFNSIRFNFLLILCLLTIFNNLLFDKALGLVYLILLAFLISDLLLIVEANNYSRHE